MNVYDFDNTIYDGESLVDLILYYVAHDPHIWPYIPGLLMIWFKDVFHLFTVEQAVIAYSGFLEGYYVRLGDTDMVVKKFWNKNFRKIKPFYDNLRKDDDVIVSGSVDFLLEEAMNRMNISRYICSSIDKQTGKFTRLCFLENKVRAFREEYPDAEIENFYTDSMNDKAMIDISKHVYLVKKDKITRIK